MTETMPRIAMTAGPRWHGRALGWRGRRARGAAFAGAAGGGDPAGFAFALSDGPGHAASVASGTRLCRHLDLYHDGDPAAVACARTEGQALVISCGAFGGSYLSLVAAVPEALASRFGPGRILRLHMDVGSSRPLAVFLRLNIGSPDGHEAHYETLIVHSGQRTADFDLDGVRLPYDSRLRAWADIIFSRPAGAEIAVSGLGLRLVCKAEL